MALAQGPDPLLLDHLGLFGVLEPAQAQVVRQALDLDLGVEPAGVLGGVGVVALGHLHGDLELDLAPGLDRRRPRDRDLRRRALGGVGAQAAAEAQGVVAEQGRAAVRVRGSDGQARAALGVAQGAARVRVVAHLVGEGRLDGQLALGAVLHHQRLAEGEAPAVDRDLAHGGDLLALGGGPRRVPREPQPGRELQGQARGHAEGGLEVVDMVPGGDLHLGHQLDVLAGRRARGLEAKLHLDVAGREAGAQQGQRRNEACAHDFHSCLHHSCKRRPAVGYSRLRCVQISRLGPQLKPAAR
ncbi:MAG: hypothetical protein R3F62_22680 [Planctomycetota bacterium]